MPYRNAYWFVLALLALTFVAFWPSYLSVLPEAKLAHHFHAASAVLWTMLAALQSWSIHHDRWALHRTVGLSVFALFPLFLIAGLWVIHVEATTLAIGADPAENLDIARFGFFDPLANIGFAILFWGGLRYRYKVQLHARYMLGTVMFVVAPIIWRLLRNYVPGFLQGQVSFDVPFAVGNAAACAIALALYWQAPKYGRPWLLVAIIVAAQAILFLTAGTLPAWAPVFASISAINLTLLLILTAILSIGIAWHGWVAGARPILPKPESAAPLTAA
jgi:hypothetical protein